MRVIRRQIVFRPLTRQFCLVTCLFYFASVPGIEFLCSGYGRVLPWASIVFLVLLALHATILAVTICVAICERPVALRRDFVDPNYREHEL